MEEIKYKDWIFKRNPSKDIGIADHEYGIGQYWELTTDEQVECKVYYYPCDKKWFVDFHHVSSGYMFEQLGDTLEETMENLANEVNEFMNNELHWNERDLKILINEKEELDKELADINKKISEKEEIFLMFKKLKEVDIVKQ
jgi:hypothetical protein